MKLMDGQILPRHVKWEREVVRKELEEDFAEFVGRSRDRGLATQLGMLLPKMLPANYPSKFQRQVTGIGVPPTKPWYWGFPSLAKCLAQFDTLMKTNNDWPPGR